MLKKTITYKDYLGNEKTKDCWFNLSKSEIMEMELSTPGGLTATLNKVIAAQDAPSIIKIFKDLVLKSYGVISPDGEQFIKSEQLRTEFSQTVAYDQLFMELATDAEKAAEFVNGIIPAEIAKTANAALPVA